jgi:hypothetical protein
MSLKELGVTEEMLDGLVASTFIKSGGYKTLTKDEVKDIFRFSL